MARVSFGEEENYNTGGRGSFFFLKDDKDRANVRFLYSDVNDIEGYNVYKVQVGDKERYVNALRTYNEPIENDPFAMAGFPVQVKLFIPVYNIDAGEVQMWERGKNFFAKIGNLASHFNPLYKQEIEITRLGAKGDTKTDYQLLPLGESEFDLNRIEIPNPLGTIILDKTYEEMAYYVEHKCFPESNNSQSDANYQSQNQMPTGRRTPGTGTRVF